MTRNTSTASLRRAVLIGAGAGVIASLVMAMYAMLAAYAKDTGFLTPLYHIASLLTDDADMMKSMMADQQNGDAFTFLFGVIASRLRLGVAALPGVGMVYGFFVFVVSAYSGLPLAAAIFDSGDPIKNMAEMAGWGTFIIEHLMYGVVLGLLAGVARTKTAAMPATTSAH